MMNQEISKEYNNRITRVINFILKNLREELSLEKLASIANYSPFHFQKLFKQIVGESPKQYIIRVRLENSAHSLFIYRQKSITEISLDSGFASNATFARAFKKYFGISAEEFRNLSPKEKISLRQFSGSKKKKTSTDNEFINTKYDAPYWTENLKVSVKRIASLHVIFANAVLSDTEIIRAQFKKIIQVGETHDILKTDTQFIGLINPHQGLYRTAITIDSQPNIPKDVSSTVIQGGKFATYKIKGSSLQTFHSLHAFYEMWLPHSGYKIADSNGFEILSENPATLSYDKIEREIYISIEPT